MIIFGPCFTLLGAAGGKVYWEGDVNEESGDVGSLFLPVTAQGLPVDYLAALADGAGS